MRFKLGLKKEVAENITLEQFEVMFKFAFDAEGYSNPKQRTELIKSEFKRITGREPVKRKRPKVQKDKSREDNAGGSGENQGDSFRPEH